MGGIAVSDGLLVVLLGLVAIAGQGVQAAMGWRLLKLLNGRHT